MHGDTALTLIICGKITIKNGHYPIHTGPRTTVEQLLHIDALLDETCGERSPIRSRSDQGPHQVCLREMDW